MNLNHGPTAAQLAQLLQGCNDEAAHHLVWVDHGGEVHVTPLPKNNTPAAWARAQDTLKFRLDTLVRGQKQVGATATANAPHVAALLSQLVRRWTEPEAEPVAAPEIRPPPPLPPPRRAPPRSRARR